MAAGAGMKFSAARALLASQGYDLVARDETTHGRPVCRIYAVANRTEYFLCNLSAFPFAGVKLFQEWIQELPPIETAVQP